METGSNGAKSIEEVEVVAKAERRRFTAEYKLRVLHEADRCKQPGEIGALLRREGLYWSNLITWRKQRQNGELVGLRGEEKGPQRRERNPLAKRVRELERENLQLKRRAERAEGIVELQKKSRRSWGSSYKRAPRATDGYGERAQGKVFGRIAVRGTGSSAGEFLSAATAPARGGNRTDSPAGLIVGRARGSAGGS